MLPPEAIDKMRREKEETDQPSLQIPIYPIEILDNNEYSDERDEKNEEKRIIIIDLL